jgi:hypothetical protein
VGGPLPGRGDNDFAHDDKVSRLKKENLWGAKA